VVKKEGYCQPKSLGEIEGAEAKAVIFVSACLQVRIVA